MKKISAALLCAVLLCLTGCRDNGLSYYPRVYVLEGSDDPMPASVILYEDGRFQLHFSALSSYIGVGRYTVENDTLVLRTDDDGGFVYTFDVGNDKLVFNAERSSEIVWFSGMKDGSVFK